MGRPVRIQPETGAVILEHPSHQGDKPVWNVNID
jgi:hypothetical protein